MQGAWDAGALPFCTVVLATEDGHLFVVEKGHASEGPALGVIQVAADVLSFGKMRKVRSGVVGEGDRAERVSEVTSPPLAMTSWSQFLPLSSRVETRETDTRVHWQSLVHGAVQSRG